MQRVRCVHRSAKRAMWSRSRPIARVRCVKPTVYPSPQLFPMHSHFRLPLAAAAVACAVLAASASAQQQQATPVRALGIDTTNFDRAIRPQDDFFRFVNGSWLEHTQIPADASGWGAFNELTEKSRSAIHQIVEDAAKSNAPAGSEERKIGDLYQSYMDSARIEQLGTKP